MRGARQEEGWVRKALKDFIDMLAVFVIVLCSGYIALMVLKLTGHSAPPPDPFFPPGSNPPPRRGGR